MTGRRVTGYRAASAIAWCALVAAIAVVEVGWRAAEPGMAVDVPTPDRAAGAIERLRSVPLVQIADERAAAVASGVVFGRTEQVGAADEQAFLDSGLWHLLAASGQNIALVAACCVVIARIAGAGRTTGAVLALVAIPAYVVVVGGGASIVRAGIMGELVLVAWLLGRLADMRHVLVVVAAAICWTWPGAHRGLGMQLSFACVAALGAWAVPMTSALRERGVPTWLAGGLAATLVCSVVTAPLLLVRTGSAPLAGVLANVVAVPVAACLLVTGLVGAVVSVAADAVGFGAAANWAMAPAAVLAGALVRIAGRAASMPAASTDAAGVAVGVPVLLLVAMVARRRLGAGRARRVVLGGIAAAAALLATTAVVDTDVVSLGSARVRAVAPGQVRVAMLDVGQGDATLIASEGRAVLVDTGPPDGDVVRRVRRAGVRRLDGIVLTHDSLDHRGGYDAALGALRPGWVAMPRDAPGPWQRIRDSAPRIVELCAGGAFEVGGARIDVLHPPCGGSIAPRTGDLHNDGAMVLLVTHARVRMLLPADAEAPVLVGLGLPRLAVLRVAHHGSEDRALPELLARTRPQLAAISAGEGNEYGHPRRQVLDALRDADVRVLRTDRDGSVVLDSDGRRVTLAR